PSEAITPSNANGALNTRIAFHTESVNTAPTGRCCLPGSQCVILTQTECTTTLLGTYGGDNSKCMGTCATGNILWHQGPLSTGATSSSGTAAPAGATWSEVQKEGNCVTNVNGLSGNIGGTTDFRVEDDFTITDSGGWDVTDVTLYSYQSPGN